MLVSQFSNFGFAEPLLSAVVSEGYENPTPIQQKSIPPLLEGRDLIGIAQTGTGKTAAFILPMLDKMAKQPRPPGAKRCRMLVLAPTRELAAQIQKVIVALGDYLQAKVHACVGGTAVWVGECNSGHDLTTLRRDIDTEVCS